MKWFDFLITKLTICIIIGIVIGYYFPISISKTLSIFCLSFLLLCIQLFVSKKKLLPSIWFGIFTYTTSICIGILIENVHQERNFENHYSHFVSKESKAVNSTIRISEVLKSTTYYDRYIGEFIKMEDKLVSGKLLVHVKKDSLAHKLQVDHIVHINVPFKEIKKALNPSSFNYKTYLNKRYIFHQVSLDKHQYIVSNTSANTYNGLAATIRKRIHKNLASYQFPKDVLAVVNALLLGQRQHLSKTLQTDYANAGAIHILAISGLHIGIIVMLLQFVLKPLERWRFGKLIKVFTMIFVLWSFAFLSGLSASVVRAVTMFTAVVIAMHLKRTTNTFQVLTISMFFLIVCKPHFIFDIGFQLSYAAVFSIVWMQPLWKLLWNPKSWFGRSFWGLLTVSLSAQLGVLPLSLFYFHQFPGLFFIANLTIIPVLGFILTLGIIVIILAYFNLLPDFLAMIYIHIIETMNSFITWIASHKSFVIQDVHISFLQMIGFYMVLIAIIYFFHQPKPKILKLVLVSIILCQSVFILNYFQSKPIDAFSIFHQSRYTIISKTVGNTAYTFHNVDSTAAINNFILKTQKSKYAKTAIDTLRNVYRLGSETLLRIDSIGIYRIPNFSPDYVLLSDSPKINLNRMISILKPKMIIADGSNYKSYIARWKLAATIQKIPFHYTGEKGFFSILLKE